MRLSIVFVFLATVGSSAGFSQPDTPQLVSGPLSAQAPAAAKVDVPVEEIRVPGDSISIVQVDSSIVPAFVLGSGSADFLLGGHKQASVRVGVRDEVVFGGRVSFWDDEGGVRHFQFADPAASVKLTVQGHPFVVGPGSGVSAVKGASGVWVFTTTGKGAVMENPGSSVASVETVSKVPQASSVAPSWAPHSAGSESRTARDQIARELYVLPAYKFRYVQTPLSQVFSLLAKQCGITFFSAVSGDSDAPKDVLIDARGTENPFLMMELIAAENGYSVELISSSVANPLGNWTIRSFEREGLIGRAYFIKHNDQEVESMSGSSAPAAAATSSGSGGGGPSLQLSQSSNVFTSDSGAALQKQVQTLLDITDPGVLVDGDTDYTEASGRLDGGLKIPALSNHKGVQGIKGRVIYSADSRILYVIATRQQHEWVRGYLRSFDRPLRNVALEVKFVETLKSPSENYGIQWPSSVRASVTPMSSLSSASVAATTTSTTSSASSAIPITTGGPFAAVLSQTDLQFVLSALKSDSKDTTIKYFYTVVSENREAVLRNLTQQPVLAASSQTSGGSTSNSGSVQQASVSYLPIGTTLNLHAKVGYENEVALNMLLSIQSIAGTTVISGNPYPIAATRDYHGPVTVGSGRSIAIGGLDEYDDTVSSSGVPGMSNLPGLGWLFKNQSVQKSHGHLIIFVTPRVLDGIDSGIESMEQGTSLGRTRREGYIVGSSRDLEELRKAANGLTGMTNDLLNLREEGSLNTAYLSDVNGLYVDVLGMLSDYHRLSAGREGSNVRFLQELERNEHELSTLFDFLNAQVAAERSHRS